MSYLTKARDEFPNLKPDHEGPCSRCGQSVPLRVLLMVRERLDKPPVSSCCLACLAINELAIAQERAEQSRDGWDLRCERCKRRGRVLQDVCGFKVCKECA